MRQHTCACGAPVWMVTGDCVRSVMHGRKWWTSKRHVSMREDPPSGFSHNCATDRQIAIALQLDAPHHFFLLTERKQQQHQGKDWDGPRPKKKKEKEKERIRRVGRLLMKAHLFNPVSWGGRQSLFQGKTPAKVLNPPGESWGAVLGSKRRDRVWIFLDLARHQSLPRYWRGGSVPDHQ